MTNARPTGDILPPPEHWKPGKLSALGQRFSSGVRSVIGTVPDLAAEWHAHNLVELATSKPLWIALGDSTAQGVGADSRQTGYVGQLETHLQTVGHDYALINLSRTGAKMRDVLTTQLGLVDRLIDDGYAVELITCTAGANDLMASARIGHICQQMGTMVKELGARSNLGVVGEVLHSRQSFIGKAVNRRQRDAAETFGVRIATVGQHLNDHPGGWSASMAADKFHPNTHGYTAYANAFIEQLSPPDA